MTQPNSSTFLPQTLQNHLLYSKSNNRYYAANEPLETCHWTKSKRHDAKTETERMHADMFRAVFLILVMQEPWISVYCVWSINVSIWGMRKNLLYDYRAHQVWLALLKPEHLHMLSDWLSFKDSTTTVLLGIAGELVFSFSVPTQGACLHRLATTCIKPHPFHNQFICEALRLISPENEENLCSSAPHV